MTTKAGAASTTVTHVASVADLSQEQVDAWMRMQADHAALASPFFHPEFHRIVDCAYRESGLPTRVEVVVVTRGDHHGAEPVAFWPFEREGPRLGVAAGRQLNDYQGLIHSGDLDVDPDRLLRAASLDRWRFDHVPVDQPVFGPRASAVAESPQIDISKGWAHYASITTATRKLDQYERRITRDLGPLHVEETTDPHVLDTLLRWKSRQYLDADKRDLFAQAWCRAAAAAFVDTDTPAFGGHLTAMWAGDCLLATHLGVRSGATLHYWFPAYDRDFSRYSPGMVLLLELARRGSDDGVEVIDMGKGDQPYKDRLATTSRLVGKGTVERRTARTMARHAGRRAKQVARSARRVIS